MAHNVPPISDVPEPTAGRRRHVPQVRQAGRSTAPEDRRASRAKRGAAEIGRVICCAPPLFETAATPRKNQSAFRNSTRLKRSGSRVVPICQIQPSAASTDRITSSPTVGMPPRARIRPSRPITYQDGTLATWYASSAVPLGSYT